jgi:hypothetical protein
MGKQRFHLSSVRKPIQQWDTSRPLSCYAHVCHRRTWTILTVSAWKVPKFSQTHRRYNFGKDTLLRALNVPTGISRKDYRRHADATSAEDKTSAWSMHSRNTRIRESTTVESTFCHARRGNPEIAGLRFSREPTVMWLLPRGGFNYK